jgi:hypothetical protein
VNWWLIREFTSLWEILGSWMLGCSYSGKNYSISCKSALFLVYTTQTASNRCNLSGFCSNNIKEDGDQVFLQSFSQIWNWSWTWPGYVENSISSRFPRITFQNDLLLTSSAHFFTSLPFIWFSHHHNSGNTFQIDQLTFPLNNLIHHSQSTATHSQPS